ncbi:3-hydroxyacyl-[acyl-carrier-protein] dehydratase FabZ, partial [Pelagibacteraceae bacterium]|nr:3-hydroxyacyl-[acyl-carrier-protein] dehydratase FabZ [Pelagibacteraceae bacterium]
HGKSKKLFTENEYFFNGHFPDNPIVPGVIIVEAMAQTAGIVVSYKLRDFIEKSVLFMSVNRAKFRKPVIPNEQVIFEVKFLNSVRDVYKFEGVCFKGDVKVSEAEFSAMITYK